VYVARLVLHELLTCFTVEVLQCWHVYFERCYGCVTMLARLL